jgi:two-component system LytT family sensor kinase
LLYKTILHQQDIDRYESLILAKMNIRKRSLKFSTVHLHVMCWALFILYEIFVAYSFSGKFASPFDYAGHYILNICLFYWNTYFTLQVSLNGKRKSYSLLILLLLLEFLAYMLLKHLFYQVLLYFGIYLPQHMPSLSTFIMQSLWRVIYFIGLSTGYWFALSRLSQRKVISDLEKSQLLNKLEKEAIEKELLVAENTYLKAQINPHFLFNVLGVIHNHVYKLSASAGETVTLLADMMRYALSKPQPDDLVELSAEIEHINNYIMINQYRFDHKLKLSFEYEGNIERTRIIPLLFITIVENVFKYGELINTAEPAIIKFTVTQDKLLFLVQNKKRNKINIVSSGIGMSNIEKRLEQRYKDKFLLNIENTDQQYALHLAIDLI